VTKIAQHFSNVLNIQIKSHEHLQEKRLHLNISSRVNVYETVSYNNYEYIKLFNLSFKIPMSKILDTYFLFSL